MRRALLVLLLLTAFAAGVFFAGLRATVPGSTGGSDKAQGQRPSHLQEAWSAFERDQFEQLEQALEDLRRDPPEDPAFAAEAELIPLMRAGDRGALRTFADQHQDMPAGAVALEHLIATSQDAAEREALLQLLRARYPRTWRGEARTK